MNIKLIFAVLALSLTSVFSFAGTPTQNSDGVTEIYLDQYNGYFAARDTLAG